MKNIYVRHYDEDQTAYSWHECMLGNDPLPEPGERVRAIANDGGQMLTCEAVATADGIELDTEMEEMDSMKYVLCTNEETLRQQLDIDDDEAEIFAGDVTEAFCAAAHAKAFELGVKLDVESDFYKWHGGVYASGTGRLVWTDGDESVAEQISEHAFSVAQSMAERERKSWEQMRAQES